MRAKEECESGKLEGCWVSELLQQDFRLRKLNALSFFWATVSESFYWVRVAILGLGFWVVDGSGVAFCVR